jgi:hypothetical protein
MKSVKYKYCYAGVSWNVNHDLVLLQLTDDDSQTRVKLTPEEAIKIANKLLAVAQMLIAESENENT